MSLTQDRPIPDFEKGGGLLPVIAQDAATGDVLMLAWMNELAFQETVRTGNAVYFSRSRGKLWRKGEESGHVQRVLSIRVDCDADAILLMVDQKGAACHEGYRSCFFRELNQTQQAQNQTRLIAERLLDPEEIYASSGHSRPQSESPK